MSRTRVRVLAQPIPGPDGTRPKDDPCELTGSGFAGVMVADDGRDVATLLYCTRKELVVCTSTLLRVAAAELGVAGLLEIMATFQAVDVLDTRTMDNATNPVVRE